MMMNKIIWLFLVVFTLITAIISGSNYALISILTIADIKLYMVAFHYMELKKAHPFWRISLSLLIVLVTLTVYILRR